MPEFMQDELLPVQTRRTNGMQNDFKFVSGKPKATDRAAV
ncbi:hypothetical protein CVCC1112_2873 [Paenarthrobacter nicotinovorans]|nr:hypothetical protein CVCC1112_2873 [Paenarthrobacter nicotinovorans]